MRNIKGDGTEYYRKALEKQAKMTEKEKEEQEKWWNDINKNFKYIGEKDGHRKD